MAKGKKPTPQELYWERKRKEEREKVALLPPGFVNHGNTCFMNSVLQGLVATHLLEDFVRFRLPDSHQPLTSRRSPLLTNGRGPHEAQLDWVQGMILGDTFIQILERSWRMRDAREKGSISPKELLSRLGAKYDQYLDFRQQDAHEFLIHILDGMRMEEFDIIKLRQPPPPRKKKSRALSGVKYPHPEPIPEEERLMPFVDMVFGGKLASVLICETCKSVSQTLEDFDDLSLSITHDESKERMRDRLRTFAAKFIASSRTRGQVRPQSMSFSQPPSPPLLPTTLDIPEDVPLEPRRRSLESPRSKLDSSLGVPKPSEPPQGDTFSSFGSATRGEMIGEVPVYQQKGPSWKVSDAGLSKLGRRISAGIALSGKRDKRLSKVEAESKAGITEEVIPSGKDTETEVEMTSVALPSSRPGRQISLTPARFTRKDKSKSPKPSKHDSLKQAYIHRLLEDSAVHFSNPLTALRGPVGSQWTRLGSAQQSIEECLRMFTGVEALDGENKFGCRNCWKMANVQRPDRRKSGLDTDSESSENEGEEDPRQGIINQIHSLSLPNLLAGRDADLPALPPYPTSTSPMAPPYTPIPSRTVDSNAPPTSSSSISMERHSQQPPHHILPPDGEGTRHPRFSSAGDHYSRPIPTITANSPSSDGDPLHAHSTLLDLQSPPPRRSLQHHGAETSSSKGLLQPPPPSTHTSHRHDIPRESESSLSSEESEYGDSGVSDGEGSVSSLPTSAAPLPKKSGVPRSKQVVYRRALKRYLISRPPPILVIHLKRFQQVSKTPVTLFGNLKKLDEYISFPEYLDIRPFLAPKKEDYGLGKGDLKGKVKEAGNRVEDQPCVYRLYAVVVHIGNMLGGHYIAYTACSSLPEVSEAPVSGGHPTSEPIPGKMEANSSVGSAVKKERYWCYISDTVVRLASLEEVLKSKAYICMYEQLT